MDNEIEVKKSAIDNYSVFSNGQKKILKILVELDAPVPVNIIQNIAQVSRQSFNFSIHISLIHLLNIGKFICGIDTRWRNE